MKSTKILFVDFVEFVEKIKENKKQLISFENSSTERKNNEFFSIFFGALGISATFIQMGYRYKCYILYDGVQIRVEHLL